MSQIDELGNRLDTLTTATLMPLRASKHVDHRAGQLSRLVAELISEVGDAPMIPRRLTGESRGSSSEAIRTSPRARAAGTRHTQILTTTTPASPVQDHDLRLE